MNMEQLKSDERQLVIQHIGEMIQHSDRRMLRSFARKVSADFHWHDESDSIDFEKMIGTNGLSIHRSSWLSFDDLMLPELRRVEKMLLDSMTICKTRWGNP